MEKFKTQDLIKLLGTIVNAHVEHYQSDFDIDTEKLAGAAKNAGNTDQEDRTFLWMVRTCGTWLLPERNVYLRGSHAYGIWTYYADQEPNEILAYRIEVSGMEDGKITGSVYELNYKRHCQYIMDMATRASQVRLVYENGERMHPAGECFPREKAPALGALLSCEPMPDDPQKLEELLRRAGDSSNWNSRKLKI